MFARETMNFYERMKSAEEQNILYQSLDNTQFTGRTITIRGREQLYFANCCYLGLETDPRIKQAASAAIEQHGILLSNSRAYLSSPLYKELEDKLNRMLPGHPVITTTTTLGHCSALPLLIGKDDLVIFDRHTHNSMQMAAAQCRAQGTKIIIARRHNDMNCLEELIRKYSTPYKNHKIWFLCDGIYSMQGEFLQKQELIRLLDEYEQLHAYIDDAHGMGWTGIHGAGYALGEQQIHPRMIVALSMCKSFGSSGGILIFPNHEWAHIARLLGQTLFFSAPLSNALLGAAIASAKIHLSEELPLMQNELIERIRRFQKGCIEKNIHLTSSAHIPIKFIEIGTSEETLQKAAALKEKGIYVSSAIYPAMPRNHGGLRISLTRHLTLNDIDTLIDALPPNIGHPHTPDRNTPHEPLIGL